MRLDERSSTVGQLLTGVRFRAMSRCPTCGHENQAGAKFCSGCAAPMVETAVAVRDERKLVTVLFADLVGFTSRSEQLDPEDVRAFLSPYYARLRTELERFGGTVEKFIGDAVMALFGAPVAHEDDPERAVRAALAIRDWVLEQEKGLEVRIAVNTGEVLVALGARASKGEGMASGDVVNTTARLQTAAPVNGILVGEATYRATSQVINFREAEAVTAKGKALPVPAWEALEARSRLGTDLARVSRAPLAGRLREMNVLKDALQRVRGDRSTHLVTLAGVPGMGKSRLVAELFKAVAADPSGLVFWRQGAPCRTGKGSPSGHWPRWSKPRPGSWRRTLTRRPRRSSGHRSRRSLLNQPTRGGSRAICAPLPDCALAVRAAATGAMRRSRPGGASSRRLPSRVRWCSSSRTSTGQTTTCSISSSTLSAGLAESRCWWCARPGRSCSSAVPAGEVGCAAAPRSGSVLSLRRRLRS